MSDLFGDRARARRSDPHTSHEAADAATAEITTARAAVEAYAKRQGSRGFTDAQMSHDLGDDGSTLRSRRAELTDADLILDSGRTDRFQDSERERIVWVHRDFVPNAPGRAEPKPRAAKAAAKAEALPMASELDGFAASMHREGRAAFADRLREAARIMRALV